VPWLVTCGRTELANFGPLTSFPHMENVLRYIESPHTETWVTRFDEDEVAVTIVASFMPPPEEPALRGTRRSE